MTDKQTPPDWVLIEAAKRCGRNDWGIEHMRAWYYTSLPFRAVCDMIAKYEAFRQEVSDIVDAYIRTNSVDDWERLTDLVIRKPKPDPLVDVFDDCFNKDVLEGETWSESMARRTRAALEARGLEIRENGQ